MQILQCNLVYEQWLDHPTSVEGTVCIVQTQTQQTIQGLWVGLSSSGVTGYEEHLHSAIDWSVQNESQGEWPELGLTLSFLLFLQMIMAQASQRE